MNWSIDTYFLVIASFFFAGMVKGIIGLGFPTIILAILSITIGIRDAMAIMWISCLATNIYQSLSGGHLKAVSRRIWPLLLTAAPTAWLTTSVLSSIDAALLSCMLGIIVCCYSILGLLSLQPATPKRHERWLTPCIGLINGVVTGLTGTFVVPGVLYLQSLNMHRDVLIQAMGVLFLTSTAALGTGLITNELMSGEHLLVSTGALLPSFLGMWGGQHIRKAIPENNFRSLFFTSLLILGAYILFRCFR